MAPNRRRASGTEPSPRRMICGVGRPVIGCAVEDHVAGARLQQAEDHLHGGRLAAGIAAEQADDLPAPTSMREIVMDLDRPVERVDAVELEDGVAHGAASAGSRACADLARAEIGGDHGGIGGDLARAGPRRSCAPSSITMTRSESCITRSSLCSISRMVNRPFRRADDLQHFGGFGRIHAGGRLVEEQHARLERERARDLEAAAVRIGEREGRIVDARRQPLAEQREDLHRVGAQRCFLGLDRIAAAPTRAQARRPGRSPAIAGAPRRAACARRPAHCRARERFPNTRPCWNVRAKPSGASLLGRQAGDVAAREGHASGVRRIEPGDEIEHRGLAGAVRPDDADQLAFVRPQATAHRPP